MQRKLGQRESEQEKEKQKKRERNSVVAASEPPIKPSCRVSSSWAFQIHEAIIFFFFFLINLDWLFLKLCN